ncbi:MAG: FG-GAP-like repeat-containing protein [Candidatus Altiarchaeia archaeon]
MAFSAAYAQSNDYLVPDWQYQSNDYITKVDITDLNGDGVAEIIASSRDGIVYNLGSKTSGHVNWQTIVGGNIRDFIVLDYDKDGKKEVLLGSDKTGVPMRLLDWQGLNKGSTIDFEQRVYAVDAADVDGDNANDLIIGGSDHRVYVLKSRSMPDLWQYESKGVVQYVKAADIDADSKTEVVGVSTWSLNEDDLAEVYVLDNTGKLRWSYAIPGGIFSASNGPASVSDINGDGKMEILVGGKNGLTALDSRGSVLWDYPTEKLVNVVYVPGSGNGIFVGATPYVYSLDDAGKLVWKYPVNTTVFSLYASDMNSDGKEEILVGALKYIHVLSEDSTPIVSWFYSDVKASSNLAGKNFETRSITAGDVDADGIKEVVAGFGWTEGKSGQNYYSGLVQVFKVNAGAVATNAPTTAPVDETTRRATTQASTTKPVVTEKTTTTQPLEREETTSTEAGMDKPAATPGNMLLLVAVVGALGLLVLIAVVVAFILLRKKNPPKKKDGQTKLSDV